MALNAVPGFSEGVSTFMAEALKEEALGSARFFRAMHHRETPYPILKGKKKALKRARKLGVYAEIKWVRDPDWEPLKVEWREDD